MTRPDSNASAEAAPGASPGASSRRLRLARQLALVLTGLASIGLTPAQSGLGQRQVAALDTPAPAVISAAMAPAAAVPVAVPAAPLAPIAAAQAPLTPQTVTLNLGQLGLAEPLRLIALDGGHTVPFSVRADEVVTRLHLRLDLRFAAELPLQQSQIKVTINDESVATLAVERDANLAQMVREIEIDPRLLTDYNRLGLQLITPRTLACERVDRASLWAQISPASTLAMSVQALPVANDLALLPAPFFDRRDNRRLDLPFVMPARASTGMLQAAGVMASWFGALASYRGAEIHGRDSLPAGNAVVLATPQEQAPGLLLPSILGPTIRLVDHPQQPNAKLLLVLGRDVDELKWAADALSLGQLTLRGQSVLAGPPRRMQARQPYDAPNWTPTHRPVRLDELVGADTLHASGAHPPPFRFEVRLPPDLHFTRQDSVPLDLRWRFTPPPGADRSALNITFNDGAVRTYALSPVDRFLALPDGIERQSEGTQQRYRARAQVPGGLVGRLPLSQLALRFDYDAPVDDPCGSTHAAGSQASHIDGGSTLDFSRVPHFIGLPDLAAFANSGFPFSRLADLSGTAVLLPDEPVAAEIDTYLHLMGHLGRSTGYPATAVGLGHAGDAERLADRDLVLIGTPARQPLLRQWADRLPLRLGDAGAREPEPGLLRQMLDLLPWRRQSATLGFSRPAGGGALLGFESPLASGRSVVALTATEPAQLASVYKALLDPAQISRTRGRATLIEAEGLRSLDVGPSYYVGDVGLFNRLRYVLAQHPLVLMAVLLAVAITLAWACAIWLRRLTRERLAGTPTAHLST